MAENEVKILYVHGYLGHGGGNASQLVREALEKRGLDFQFDAPQFDVTDPEAMKNVFSGMAMDYDYVVASSLGALYAMMYAGGFRILVNPALPKDLRKIRDEDPENNTKLTDTFLEGLEGEVSWFFDHSIDDEELFFTYLIFGSEDEVAGNRALFEAHYPEDHIDEANMGHRMASAGAEKVVDILEKLIKEKPVYVDPLNAALAKMFEELEEDELDEATH